MLHPQEPASAPDEPLFSRLSSGRQGLCPLFTGLRLPEEFGNMHVERCGQLVEIADCRVFDAALDPADIGPVDAGIHGELLLRHARRDPYPSQVPGDQSLPVHS